MTAFRKVRRVPPLQESGAGFGLSLPGSGEHISQAASEQPCSSAQCAGQLHTASPQHLPLCLPHPRCNTPQKKGNPVTPAAKCKLAPKSPVLCDQQATGKSHSNSSLRSLPGFCLAVGDQNAAMKCPTGATVDCLFLSLAVPWPLGEFCWESEARSGSQAGFAGHKEEGWDHELPGNGEVLRILGALAGNLALLQPRWSSKAESCT